MTKGEKQLRQKLSEGLVLELLDPVDLFEVWDKVIEIVKSGEYFVHQGKVRSVTETEWLDYDDEGWVGYTVWAEELSEEDE